MIIQSIKERLKQESDRLVVQGMVDYIRARVWPFPQKSIQLIYNEHWMDFVVKWDVRIEGIGYFRIIPDFSIFDGGNYYEVGVDLGQRFEHVFNASYYKTPEGHIQLGEN